MNSDISDSLFKESMISVVDKIYGEQYSELFPDVEPPVQTLDELNVGDAIFNSDEFIHLVIQSYQFHAEASGGLVYVPPHIVDITEDVRNQYVEEIEYLEDEGIIEEGTGLTFLMDESAVISSDIEPRVIDVLNAIEVTYIDRDVITYFDKKSNKKENLLLTRIINTSTINLFDFEFKNVWISRGNKEYEKSVREGYNNLLQISLEYL